MATQFGITWEYQDSTEINPNMITIGTLDDGSNNRQPDVDYVNATPQIRSKLSAELVPEYDRNIIRLAALLSTNNTFVVSRGPTSTPSTENITGRISSYSDKRSKGLAGYDISITVKRTDVIALIAALQSNTEL